MINDNLDLNDKVCLNNSIPMSYFPDCDEIKDEDLFEPYTLTNEEENEILKEIKEETFSNMHLSELILRKKPFTDALNELLESKEQIKTYVSFKNQMKSLSDQSNIKDIEFNDLSLKLPDDGEIILKDFIKDYGKNYAKITFALNTIKKYIDSFGDNLNSTKFLNDELRYSIQKNINNINQTKDKISEKEFNSKIKKYNICLEAIDNRENLSYIKSKFNKENKSFNTFIIKNQKFDKPRIERIIRILGDNITNEQFTAILHLINKTFSDEKFSITLIDYSAHMIKSGIGTGHFMYWKLLLLNLSSIAINQFDLDIGSEEYLNQLNDLYNEYKSISLL